MNTENIIIRRLHIDELDDIQALYAEQIEVEKFRPKGEGELEATFIHKDEHEEEFELEYITFDKHVLVWLVG